MTTPWWLLLLQVSILWIVYLAVKGIFLLSILHLTGRYHKSKSYQRVGNSKILLVGDSTAVGTGSINIDKSLGGYLARDFINTTIINRSVNGSLIANVIDQLTEVSNQHFDMILICTGGNDVWALTRRKKIMQQMEIILDLSKKMSDRKVILIFFGNEGSAPFFPLFLKSLLIRKTNQVRSVFAETASKSGVPLIELFSNPKENPFIIDPNRHFAPDGLHPNEYGYWVWYKHLWRLMVKENFIFRE